MPGRLGKYAALAREFIARATKTHRSIEQIERVGAVTSRLVIGGLCARAASGHAAAAPPSSVMNARRLIIR